MKGDGRGDGEGFGEMNVSERDVSVLRMSRHWKRPVISPRDGFRVQFSSCKLSGKAWACISVRVRTEEHQKGQGAADVEKSYCVIKVGEGMILFLRGDLGLMWNSPSILQHRHQTNIWWGLTVGVHKRLWVHIRVSLPGIAFVSLNPHVYCFVWILGACVLFVQVGECRFIGRAHLWSQTAVDSKVISLSSESLAVFGFHLWSLSSAKLQAPTQRRCPSSLSASIQFLSLSLSSLSVCRGLSWAPPKLNNSLQYDSTQRFELLVWWLIKMF